MSVGVLSSKLLFSMLCTVECDENVTSESLPSTTLNFELQNRGNDPMRRSIFFDCQDRVCDTIWHMAHHLVQYHVISFSMFPCEYQTSRNHQGRHFHPILPSDKSLASLCLYTSDDHLSCQVGNHPRLCLKC
jgi:hypothetical protein